MLAVLDLLAAHPEREYTLTEIVAALGLSKATCHAVVITMVEHGYLARSPLTKTYALGAAVIVAGRAAEVANGALRLARGVVAQLSAELDVDAVASVIDRDMITVVEWAPGSTVPGRDSWSHVGQRIPLVPPFGAVQMAWSSPERIADWQARGVATSPSERVAATLAAIRSRGFDVQTENVGLDRFRATLDSIDLDRLSASSRAAVGQLMAELGEIELLPAALDRRRSYNVNALSAPVFDAGGVPALTLSVHPAAAMRGGAVMAMGVRLRAIADDLTAASGGMQPG